jgi:anti-sigma B factor antagonist
MDDMRATAQLNIQVVHLDAAPVVILAGEIDVSTAGELRTSLEPLGGRVLVDLYGVSFMDSSGIAAFVATRKRLRASGGTLHLRSPQDQVRRMFEMVGIADWIIGHPAGAAAEARPERRSGRATARPVRRESCP